MFWPECHVECEWRDQLYVDRRLNSRSKYKHRTINNNNDLYSNRNDRLYRHSRSYGNSKSIANGYSEFTGDMLRTKCNIDCERSDKLYVDRWLSSRLTNDSWTINDHNDIYCNGNNRKLYRNCNSDSHGECITKCNSKLTSNMFRSECNVKCKWGDQLHMDRWFDWTKSEYRTINHDDDVYSNRHDGKL